jgi:hypothetical protein
MKCIRGHFQFLSAILLIASSSQATEPTPVLPATIAAEASPSGSSDPLGGNSKQEAAPAALTDPAPQTQQPETPEEKKPPLTPENSNLNLPEDLELETLDTKEKVFLPAGTYRQILQIPLDSPTMQSAQKTRSERRPVVKQEKPAGMEAGEAAQPLWIRFESLEKIKINGEERRGGIDVPIRGPKDVTLRLWYAKSETADTASSVFYFLFGGLGYSTANLLGWSAGNTRQIPSDFEYRLIRK